MFCVVYFIFYAVLFISYNIVINYSPYSEESRYDVQL